MCVCACVCVIMTFIWKVDCVVCCCRHLADQATLAGATVRSSLPRKASEQDKYLAFGADRLLMGPLKPLSQQNSSSSTLLLLMCCGIQKKQDTGRLYKAGDLSHNRKMGSNYSWCGPDFISMQQFVCSKHRKKGRLSLNRPLYPLGNFTCILMSVVK